jgi:hypothetical protein
VNALTHASIIVLLLLGATAAESQTRSVHVFVALADNKHQGIVPVPARLGDGDEPADNLYWGAIYGVKTFLGKSADWTLVSSTNRPGHTVLERCVFLNKTEDVVLVADAYRGKEIKQAIRDFLRAAAGHPGGVVAARDRRAATYGGAALTVYIGHNGLMDFDLPSVQPGAGTAPPDAIVLACKSRTYFGPRLRRMGSEPLLLTTGLMAPEAYVLEAALRAWTAGRPTTEIREKAAQAYNKYQKCGIRAARRLFSVQQ